MSQTHSRALPRRAKGAATLVFTLGVVADTHLPDRVRSLHPRLIPTLQKAGVERIFHAGDVTSAQVLTALECVAPVTAARGNRDWLLPALPPLWTEQIAGVTVALMHGHGGLWAYLTDKWRYLRQGYRLAAYAPAMLRAAPTAQVIIFGHTHYPETAWLADGRLLFNPGSASFGIHRRPPGCGVLRFLSDGTVQAQTIPLRGWRLTRRGEWVAQYGG